MTTRPVVFAGLALILASVAHAQSAPGKDRSGKQLYFEHACYACHGYTGETGERVLVGSPMLASEQLFITFLRLRADQNPLTPSDRMPNFPRESLGDAEARKLYAFIKAFKSNAPGPDAVPVFKAILGAAARPR